VPIPLVNMVSKRGLACYP